jgi:hypothetical protein
MLRDGPGEDGTMARAAAAMNTLKKEIDQLWHDSMVSDDGSSSDRLVAVSHAIRRASYLLDEDHAIG